MENMNPVLYSKKIPALDLHIEFSLLDPHEDLDIFHRWHWSPRVSYFWEMNKDKKELQDYILEKRSQEHADPILVKFNSIPTGYLETYWAYHDRIKPYYDAQAHDRGFHFLIGETSQLGGERTAAFLTCVCDYLFLCHEQTQRIVAEPRVDNKLLLRYLQRFASWNKEKEFDFPHKRAALLMCQRELFYSVDKNYELIK